MKWRYFWCVPMIAMIALSVFAAEPSLPYPADPETKKAIGAKEMTAAELKKKIDAGEQARYVRILGYGNSENNCNSITEVRIPAQGQAAGSGCAGNAPVPSPAPSPGDSRAGGCAPALPKVAGGKVYYVSPGQSINQAVRKLKPGDTLYIRGGTYNEAIRNIPGGTSWSKPVIVASYAGEKVTIKPTSGPRVLHFQGTDEQYIIVDGLTLDASNVGDGIKITQGGNQGYAHHIRIQNTEVRNARNQGVLVGGPGCNEFINLNVHDNGDSRLDHGFYISSGNNLIENSLIHGNSGFGVHLYSGKGNFSNNNIVRNNHIYDSGHGQGIIVSSGSSNKVYNNIVTGNPNGGIRVDYRGTNAEVYNNVVYGNSNYGILLKESNATVSNNLVYQNRGANIRNNGTGTKLQNNSTTAPGTLPKGVGPQQCRAPTP